MRIYSSVRFMFAQSQLLLIINTKLPFMPHHAYKQQPAEVAISSSRQSVHKLFRNVFVFGASFHPHLLFVLLLTGTECGRSNNTKKKKRMKSKERQKEKMKTNFSIIQFQI